MVYCFFFRKFYKYSNHFVKYLQGFISASGVYCGFIVSIWTGDYSRTFSFFVFLFTKFISSIQLSNHMLMRRWITLYLSWRFDMKQTVMLIKLSRKIFKLNWYVVLHKDFACAIASFTVTEAYFLVFHLRDIMYFSLTFTSI